jgi:clan AA aspartic protease (TIGR02281 family)
MNISEVAVTDVDDNSFQIRCFDKEPQILDFGNGKKYELSRGVNNCIRTVYEGNYEASPPYFWTGFSLSDPYDTKKLCNAFKYLFALVEENGTYKKNDDDPFAPGNFNPKGVEIKGDTQNSIIKLDVEEGVYHIFVTIGNIKKKFVLDSGASEVSLPESFEKELINMGIIKKDYYTSSALYKLADGRIILCRRLILPELKIGNYTVTNVRTVIGKDSSPLLLGKSFLDKFKKWSIDNTTKVLNLEK